MPPSTGALGESSLPQLSVTTGNDDVAGVTASEIHATVLLPLDGNVKSATFTLIVCESVAEYPQLSVIVYVRVTTTGQVPVLDSVELSDSSSSLEQLSDMLSEPPKVVASEMSSATVVFAG